LARFRIYEMSSDIKDSKIDGKDSKTDRLKDAKKNLPWVEKYRPVSLKEVVGHHELVSRLVLISQKGNMPNLLFSVNLA
jgi:hypothetical protein